MNARRFQSRILALGLCFLCAGCLVPVPHYTGASRTNLKPEIVQSIVPGKTTREDVLLMLGEPDQVSSETGDLIYKSRKVNMFFAMGGMGMTIDWTTYRFNDLVLKFDEQGVLSDREFKTFDKTIRRDDKSLIGRSPDD